MVSSLISPVMWQQTGIVAFSLAVNLLKAWQRAEASFFAVINSAEWRESKYKNHGLISAKLRYVLEMRLCTGLPRQAAL